MWPQFFQKGRLREKEFWMPIYPKFFPQFITNFQAPKDEMEISSSQYEFVNFIHLMNTNLSVSSHVKLISFPLKTE